LRRLIENSSDKPLVLTMAHRTIAAIREEVTCYRHLGIWIVAPRDHLAAEGATLGDRLHSSSGG